MKFDIDLPDVIRSRNVDIFLAYDEEEDRLWTCLRPTTSLHLYGVPPEGTIARIPTERYYGNLEEVLRGAEDEIQRAIKDQDPSYLEDYLDQNLLRFWGASSWFMETDEEELTSVDPEFEVQAARDAGVYLDPDEVREFLEEHRP